MSCAPNFRIYEHITESVLVRMNAYVCVCVLNFSKYVFSISHI